MLKVGFKEPTKMKPVSYLVCSVPLYPKTTILLSWEIYKLCMMEAKAKSFFFFLTRLITEVREEN